MKIALTRSHHRIAPLFDSATTVELYETQGYNNETKYIGMHTCERGAKDAIGTLISMNVNVVICGAISSEYEQLLLLHHIDLYAYISGDVEDVLQGWRTGRLHTPYFSMPGCEHPRHCCHKGTVSRCRNKTKRREV
jgi:predicted Fe-Mo cluster-binding NifX family protein